MTDEMKAKLEAIIGGNDALVVYYYIGEVLVHRARGVPAGIREKIIELNRLLISDAMASGGRKPS